MAPFCLAAATLFCLLLPLAVAQQAGTSKVEGHVPINFWTCTKAGGCTAAQTSVTMDAQWRWTHNKQSTNCLTPKDAAWQTADAPDGKAAAANCVIEGMPLDDYATTYGVTQVPGGVKLNFVNGQSIGSRLYMMEDESTYKMFKLLNREFTFDVDISTLECGLNGAVYFVEMEADGGRGLGNNTAGARYGTGYCDAQCPHDLKFISGEANLEDWREIKTGPIGRYGACCAEMDIWEANFAATSYTTHACDAPGPLRCEGLAGGNDCGDTPDDCTCCLEPDCACCGRYQGNCDKDGCDYNPFRLGAENFYGKGSEFDVDTSKPVTVVTQFLTSDGTDTGDLIEIRRLYVQDGRVIQNAKAQNLQGLGIEGAPAADSITDRMCAAQKRTFGEPDDYTGKGSLKGMGEALGRGMVLVLSLWDDLLTHMHWLDAATPLDHPETHPLSKPGVRRGPCAADAGDPLVLRSQHADAYVVYKNIRVGEIDSTYGEGFHPGGDGGGSDSGGGAGADGGGDGADSGGGDGADG